MADTATAHRPEATPSFPPPAASSLLSSSEHPGSASAPASDNRPAANHDAVSPTDPSLASSAWLKEPWSKVAGAAQNKDNRRTSARMTSPVASRRGSTTVAGSPTHRAGPRSNGAYADDESSSDATWGRQRPAKASVAKKRPAARGSPSLTTNGIKPGSSFARHNGAVLPVSFGDDLDERSSSEDEDRSVTAVQPGKKNEGGWKVRLAPFNTPIRRRLQTLAVLLHVLGMGLSFTFFCFLWTVPLFWPLVIAYLVYINFSTAGTDGKTSRRSPTIRKWPIWRYFADYFPVQLHKTADLPPTRKYILAVHPHGIISFGAFTAFGTEALGWSDKFPGITNSLLTLNGNFKVPFYREYLLAMGLLSVSKVSIINTLTRGGTNGEGMGNAVSIIVGGAREALEAQPKTMRLIMYRRGFVRMAIRTGADLVPVLVFGENDLYRQWGQRDHPRFRRLQKKAMAWLGFSVPVLQGRGVFNYDFGLLPHRRPVNVVVGAPIKVHQDSSRKAGADMEKEVEKLHKIYCEKLKELYDEHKDVYFKDRKEEMRFLDPE